MLTLPNFCPHLQLFLGDVKLFKLSLGLLIQKELMALLEEMQDV